MSDGTEARQMLRYSHNSHSSPPDFTSVMKLIFTASDGTNGLELWMTNGTAGTEMVKDINSTRSSNRTDCGIQWKALLSADDGTNGLSFG